MQYVDPSASGHIYQILIGLLAVGAVFWGYLTHLAARAVQRIRSWFARRDHD